MFRLGLSFKRRGPFSAAAPLPASAAEGRHAEPLPPTEQVEKQLARVMEEQGWTEVMKSDIASASLEEKWDIVKGSGIMRTANPKIDAAKTPETYVNDVRTNVELLSNVYLQALKTEVLSCSADWLASYFAAGGLESLATIMIHAIGSDKLTHLNTCLEIVTGLISSPEDLNRVGAVPDLVTAIASSLAVSPSAGSVDLKTVMSIRIGAIKMLMALVATPECPYYRAVQFAFERLRASMGEAERYETLCTVTREPVDESAEVAEQWTFKTMVITFVNNFLNNFELEERVGIRTDLQLADWLTALQELQENIHKREGERGVVPPDIEAAWDEIRAGIDAYIAIMTEDELAAIDVSGGAAVTDPDDLFAEVLESAVSNGQTDALMTILRYLRVIPSRLTLGRTMWQRCESALRVIVTGTEASREAFTFNDMGIIFELQNAIQEQEQKTAEVQKELVTVLHTRSARPKLMPPMPPAITRTATSAADAAILAAAARAAQRVQETIDSDEVSAGATATVATTTSTNPGGSEPEPTPPVVMDTVHAEPVAPGLPSRIQRGPSIGSEEFSGEDAARRLAELEVELATLRTRMGEMLAQNSALTLGMNAAEEACNASLQRAYSGEARVDALAQELHASQSLVQRMEAELTCYRETGTPTPTAAASSGTTGSGTTSFGFGGAEEDVRPPMPTTPRPGATASGTPRPARPAGGESAGGGAGVPVLLSPPRPVRPGMVPGPQAAAPPGAPRPARPGPTAAGTARPGPSGGPSAVTARPGPGGAAMPAPGPSNSTAPARPGPGGAVAARPGPGGAVSARPGPGGPGGPGAAPRPGPGGAGPRPGVARPAAGPTQTSADPARAALKSVQAVPAGRPKKVRPKPTIKLKPLFWTKIMDAVYESTAFKDLSDERAKFDVKLLEEWFKADVMAAPTASAAASAAAAAAASKRKGPIMLLDGKRQQNAGIGLARVRMKPTDIRDAVLAANTAALGPDKLTILLSIVPTSEEVQMLHDHDGDRAGLASLEQFFLTVGDIPRYEQRLIAMLFSTRCAAMLGDCAGRLERLRAANDAMRNSTALRAVLEHLLAVGNYLNAESAARGGAYGFRMDILKKLSTIKACDGKHTMLDYLARTALDEGKARGMHRIANDLEAVSLARTESLEMVMTEAKTIERGLNQVVTQLTLASRGMMQEGDHFDEVFQPFVDAIKEPVTKLMEDANSVSAEFKDIVNAFAEEASDTGPFFQLFHDFTVEFKRAIEKELERRNPKPEAPLKKDPVKKEAGPIGIKSPTGGTSMAASPTGSPVVTGRVAAPALPPPSTARRIEPRTFVDNLVGSLKTSAAEGSESVLAGLQKRRDVRRGSIAMGPEGASLLASAASLAAQAASAALKPRPPAYAKGAKNSARPSIFAASQAAEDATAASSAINIATMRKSRRSLAAIHAMHMGGKGKEL